MLTTYEQFIAQAGANLDATVDQINSMIAGISAHVERTLHRTLWKKNYTEYLTGDNSSILQLSNFPVISVSRVNYDDNGSFGQPAGSFDPSKDLVQGTDYVLMAGRKGPGSTGQLLRRNYVWPNPYVWSPGKVAMQVSPPRGDIMVVYVAGFATIPADVVYATNAAIQRAISGAGVGGAFQSASYEDGSISTINPADMAKVIGSVERVLSGMRVPVV